MEQICLLYNTIQNYAWGSHHALAGLLGQAVPSLQPQAELWMGAHPSAPSSIETGGQLTALDRAVAADPRGLLGPRVAARFDNRLPYLFKVLAAARPLSLQVHPNLEQARAGFARENQQGLPLSAPQRNYKDANHKPEIICALTPMWALKGFRPLAESLALLRDAKLPAIAGPLALLAAQPDPAGLQRFFAALMGLDRAAQRAAAEQARAFAEPLACVHAHCHWILRLAEQYPGDIGVLSPLFCHVLHLAPGEALYLPAGEMHAYLDGVGVELMATSDNVLRGGLTPKHIDVPELLRVLVFAENDPGKVLTHAPDPQETVYETPAEEFRLSRLNLVAGSHYRPAMRQGPEMLLCTEGLAEIRNPTSFLTLKKGTSVFVPYAAGAYTLSGKAVLYRAACNLA